MQLLLGGRLARLLLGIYIGRDRLRRGGEVVAEVQRLDVDRVHRFVRAAKLGMARRELGGLGVILGDVVLPGRGGGKLAALHIAGRGGTGNLLECLRRDARLTSAGSGLRD